VNDTAPFVSVITPSYNHAAYLEETIQSVLCQNYPHLEHIIVDGASSDATLKILQRYDTHLRWLSEPDHGQADAVNKGFRLARGEILGWLNADDTYLPGAIYEVATYFQRHPDVDVLYGEAYHIDDSGNRIERYHTEPFDAERLSDICFICQPTVFFRKRVMQDIGPLNDTLHYCMDYEYWIRFAKRYRITYLSTYLANSRLHRNTKTLANQIAVHDEILYMLRQHYGQVSSRWLYAAACSTLTAKLMPYIQGMYHDGWASQWVRLFPPHTARDYPALELQGRVPTHLLPLSLHVASGEQVVHKMRVEVPNFTLHSIWQPQPLGSDRHPPSEIRITADKALCPQALGLHADQRNLSFQIRKLSLLKGNRQAWVLYTMWHTYLLLATLPVLFLWKCWRVNHTLPYHDLGNRGRQLWHYIKSRTL
jgi:glycosyltransferase involved in cell wall biosynthesis